MAFTATFHIEGHPKEQDGFNVVSCDFTFHQQVDHTGAPTSTTSGGIINIGLKNENDFDIMQWMFAPSIKKNGKIVFTSGMADNQSFQTIKFKDAVLINFHQAFSADSEIEVNLTISCRVMDISGASFDNIWESD